MENIEQQLGIVPFFTKGERLRITDCWHFYTDGKFVDSMFFDDTDFRHGMNRIFYLSRNSKLRILAFVLMDTHVHFVLHGPYDECNRFMHEYIRLTSMYLYYRYGDRNKLHGLPLSYQVIKDDLYLKTVICYTLKNPTAGGLPFLPFDYPWSSAALYFRKQNGQQEKHRQRAIVRHNLHTALKTHKIHQSEICLDDEMIPPEDFVAVSLVEKIFRTHKNFFYFMGIAKDDEIESKDAFLSPLSIPIQELRQHKTEICHELFGTRTIKNLDTPKRIKLARTLRKRYNSSAKQISRVCGLIYEEVKDSL